MNTTPNLSLRRATIGDIPLLKSWDKKPHIQAISGFDDLADWKTEITQYGDWQTILMACLGDQPIGVIIVIDPERDINQYWGKVDPNLRAIDIWIGEEAYLNQGYGTQMMTQVIRHCFEKEGASAILLDPLESNHKAMRFYERLGFKKIEKRRFGQDDCIVYRLNRDNWSG